MGFITPSVPFAERRNVNMKIVLLDGAFANQVTQYIFARCLEEELKGTNEVVYLDDLWFYVNHGSLGKSMENIEHHQYQLSKFPNIKKMNLMSEYFEPDVWQNIISIANLLIL